MDDEFEAWSRGRGAHSVGLARLRRESSARRGQDKTVLRTAQSSVWEGWRVSGFLALMTSRLLRFVGLSYFAWWMFLRLCGFATVLLPAFLRLVWRYAVSPDIVRDWYGPHRRQSVDVYLPRDVSRKLRQDGTLGDDWKPRPCIVFFSGGAWVIGYKAWGALMGFCYSQLGYIFVTPDYRNFPQVKIEEMLEDVDLAIDWCVDNLPGYGGSHEFVLMGQSAGAHLAASAVLSGLARANEVQSAVPARKEEPLWQLSNIKGFIGVSGPYNLISLCPHLEQRGLSTSLLRRLFRRDYNKYSPTMDAKRMRKELNGPLECPFPLVLIHGTADQTCPSDQSVEFDRALRKCLAKECAPSLILLPDMTHTDPIIESPMRGHDVLLSSCLNHLEQMLGSREELGLRSLDESQFKRMLPDAVIDTARYINPF